MNLNDRIDNILSDIEHLIDKTNLFYELSLDIVRKNVDEVHNIKKELLEKVEIINNLNNGEKNYYELLVDFLSNGEISESVDEMDILDKRKQKYGIPENRVKELYELAKREVLEKIVKPKNDFENRYCELILHSMGDNYRNYQNARGDINKIKQEYRISESRGKELEVFAKQEYFEQKYFDRKKKIKFESEEEKKYYELILDSRNIRNRKKILNKMKVNYGISEERAIELEYFARKENILRFY